MISFSGNLSSLILLLGALCIVAAAKSKSQWENRPYSQFVPYPENAQTLLELQDTNLEAVAPQVSILSSIPEVESDHGFIWPVIEGLAIRNADSKIMNLQPVYMMKHGLEMGCRMHRVGGGGRNGTDNNDHIPIDSPICDDHCTHQGQYCPAELPYDLAGRTKYHGKDLILEIVRRLCFGSVLPGKYANYLWFDYLKKFESNDCLEGDKPLKECSEDIISSITDWKTEGGHEEVEMLQCIADADAETDTTNYMLEHQLKLLQDVQYTWDELPVLDIDGKKIHFQSNLGQFRPDRITQSWCSFFSEASEVPAEYDPEHPVVTRPITCDFCAHCDRVENCLWGNQCDHHKFDLETFHDPKAKHNVVKEVEEVAEEVVDDTEVVVEDVTIGIMYAVVGAAVGGTVVLLICVVLNRRRRRKAIDEVANELPVTGGYNDEVSDN